MRASEEPKKPFGTISAKVGKRRVRTKHITLKEEKKRTTTRIPEINDKNHSNNSKKSA